MMGTGVSLTDKELDGSDSKNGETSEDYEGQEDYIDDITIGIWGVGLCLPKQNMWLCDTHSLDDGQAGARNICGLAQK